MNVDDFVNMAMHPVLVGQVKDGLRAIAELYEAENPGTTRDDLPDHMFEVVEQLEYDLGLDGLLEFMFEEDDEE